MLNDNWDATVAYGDTEAYFREYDRNLNSDALMFDTGLGLMSLGISLFLLIAATRTWSAARLRALVTPRSRWVIYVLGNVAWIAFMQAEMHFLMVQQDRGEFPSWADSTSIPIFGLGLMMILGLVAVNLGLTLYLHRAHLPAPMWALPRTGRSRFLSGGILILLLACLLIAYESIRSGDIFAIPTIVAIAYLLLVGRAASCAV